MELLDRQVEYLLRQADDERLLVQIGPFLRALRGEPELDAHLSDLDADAIAMVREMEQVDGELVVELIALRDELPRIWPESDDSGPEHSPRRNDAGDRVESLQRRLAYQGTLGYFDAYRAAPTTPFDADGNGGYAGTLLRILQGKASAHARAHEPAEAASGSNPDVDAAANAPTTHTVDPMRAWGIRLSNVERRYEHAKRRMRLDLQTSAGLALARLEMVPRALNPTRGPYDAAGDGLDAATDMIRWISSRDYSLFKLVEGERMEKVDVSIVAQEVARLRLEAERLHEELRRRVNTIRSRRALVGRFKQRCEWHDRDRMAAVAADQTTAGGPEDKLTREFARYLFDQGLSPLTKPMTGGLEPDLLDPLQRFYVEAKQYSKSARGELVSAVAQVLDTVGRLRGSPYAVDEAFCVIFRRHGPYYDLPESLRTETFTLHLVLVDIAPASEAGRRQQHMPIRISSDELLEAEPPQLPCDT